MKILSPFGDKIELDNSLSLSQKVDKVSELVKEFETEIENNWESTNVRYFLDGLANYLVWHKEEEMKNKEDKEVMSVDKVKQMNSFRGKSTNFTYLSEEEKASLGIEIEKMA
ncbi:hypothetical protein [Bacillus thuringiensis]|uniref:hypothetical protein n=1 Tax=Bacillus thuringiensis TaxID=1428 RepID=UPI000BF7964F|nr:hypothetical protein [Bacillus thuringiensis]PES54524.1 hypothetical protein CN506_20940 [Bacillus thuringiensis]